VIPRAHFTLQLPGNRALTLGDRTLVMGILNVTPDSFADGGLYLDPGAAEAAAIEMAARGAALIDVGGESTRPGSDPISADEEIARIRPVLERLSRSLAIPISIDTSKPEVAEVAVGEGASIINDVTGLRGAGGPSGGWAPRGLRGASGPSEARSRAGASGGGARAVRYDATLAKVAARSGAGLILMHARGRSRDMYKDANYASVALEVGEELRASLECALAAGMRRESVMLDPGLGFAKRPEHSYAALAALPAFAALGCPLVAGPSRKSFLNAAIGDRPPGERDMATAASVAAAVLLGAHIVRVHNVPAMVDVVRVADRIRGAGVSPAIL
jgi:dihydropteroate synthase